MLDRPWARVKNPTPIPAVLDRAILSRLDLGAFAELLRDNLLPRRDRGAWHDLWDLLDANDDLADRALDILESFEDTTSRLVKEPATEAADRERGKKFLEIVNQAISRLSSEASERRQQSEPLQWAGRRAEKFNPLGRRVIERLVLAIDEHRSSTSADTAGPADQELWRVLGELHLDPADRAKG